MRSNKQNVPLMSSSKITVVSIGVKGTYFPSLHLVECKCGYCGAEKQTLMEWKKHIRSKNKNWKKSVKVKGSMVLEYHERGLFLVANPPKNLLLSQEGRSCYLSCKRSMRQFMRNGQQKGVLFVDGWKIRNYNKSYHLRQMPNRCSPRMLWSK